jgi:hypothetical protein
MNRFNVFCISVVDISLYKDIPFWTTLLGKDFYPNHSFWDEFSGDIFIKTTDNFRILNFKIECIWIKYNRYYKNLKFQYKKYYGDEIQYRVENDEVISGIEFFNRNAKLYFEETGISIGTEPQDCKISNKFWEYNEFIERTRSFNVYQMKEVEMIYEPTLDDFFNKKL